MLCNFRNVVTVSFAGVLIHLSSTALAVVNTQDLNIDGPFNVPDPFINSGNLFVIGAGSIIGNLLDGPSLHIGKSKEGVLDPANFVAAANIGGIPIIHVYPGSSFTTAYHVSGVSNSLIIEENAAATFSLALSAPGGIQNNGTLTFGEGTLLTTSEIINDGFLNIANNFLVPNSFENNGALHVIGDGAIFGALTSGTILNIGTDSDGNINANNFVVHNSITNIPTITIGTGSTLTVNPATNFSYAGEVNGAGTIANNGVLTTSAITPWSVGSVVNSGDLNVQNNIFLQNPLTNTGNIFVYALGGVDGDIDGGSSLNFGKNSFDIAAGTNFSINGDVSNVDAINVYHGVLTSSNSNSFSSIGTLNISAGAEAVFNGSYDGSGAVSNYGNLYINNAFTSGLITNQADARLTLQPGANNVVSSIVNQIGGILTVASNVSMPANSIDNRGILNVNGNRNLDCDTFTSTGSLNFTIRSVNNYDSLNVSSNIDLSNGQVNIESRFLGVGDQPHSWTVLESPQITQNSNTIISIPSNSLLRNWSVEVNDDNITLNFNRISFAAAAAENYPRLASTLDEIALIETNEARALTHDLSTVYTVPEWDQAFQSLVPASHSSTKYTTTQNAMLNKAEMRIASAGNQTPARQSISYGDVDTDLPMWIAGFGSVANQKTTSTIIGYRATSAGLLIGLDQYKHSGSIFGAALGWSNSNIDESINNDVNTRIIGYHALLYGSNNINHVNFYEWLVTGILNRNTGNRFVTLGGNNYNVSSDYHSFQAGFRFNLGQYINFDSWRYSQIETVRYTMLQQPGYDETGSPAALHVASQGLGNILTFGVGSRISSNNKNHWLANSRELRAMITYDAITTDNVTAANFIVGGSDFTISNSAARWALQLGASYGFLLNRSMQLEFSYDFELRDQYTDNSGEIKLRYVF